MMYSCSCLKLVFLFSPAGIPYSMLHLQLTILEVTYACVSYCRTLAVEGMMC